MLVDVVEQGSGRKTPIYRVTVDRSLFILKEIFVSEFCEHEYSHVKFKCYSSEMFCST